MQETIDIYGAREHNLKDVSLSLPRNRLITITGVSGSGKSSLAFDTLYAEGRYRYMQSFSAYARAFMGELKRPEVEKIEGITPVVSIEQKTTHTNPRSTVGTTTEIYDFLRVLYAKVADAYSYLTNRRMVKRSTEQIIEQVFRQFSQKEVLILAPLIRDRKGHYRDLFEKIARKGFGRARVDGVLCALRPGMQLERYKQHSIEVLVDAFRVDKAQQNRCEEAIGLALAEGGGSLMVLEKGTTQVPHYFSKHLTDSTSGLSYEEPSPGTFSFNAKSGACAHCKGLGQVEEINLQAIIPTPSLSIAAGGITVIGKYRKVFYFDVIEGVLKPHGISLYTPIQDIPDSVMHEVLYGRLPKEASERAVALQKFRDGHYFKYVELMEELGIVGMLSYAFDAQRTSVMRKLAEQHVLSKPCPSCGGKRLKPSSLGFRLGDKDIIELTQLSLGDFMRWIDKWEAQLAGRKKKIAEEVLKEIRVRTRLLNELGLHYLSLDRPLKTLSGGESQRVRLATQIGSELVDVVYILDEPSIGLHPRDNHKLIASLKKLRDLGNTVVVVEHDREMIANSDHIVDVGPKAGKYGGDIVFSGHLDGLKKHSGRTAEYMNRQQDIPIPKKRRKGKHLLCLEGASGHNLKSVNFCLPLGTFTVVTGVSGSGKSTLLMETLVPLLRKQYHRAHKEPLPYEALTGAERLDKIIRVDQSPIGRTPRSNPATYTGVFTDIRHFYSLLPESKIRGYKMGHFSFNVKGGRCPACEGRGVKIIEMGLLPDVETPCEQCSGRRFHEQTLEVRHKGQSIADVLDMPIEQALSFFKDYPSIRRKLLAIQEVGLGYVGLGQHATTLSGGEAQRMKLATELLKKDTGKTLYILDEPTTGLHFEDIKKLLPTLHRLVDKGNTVVVIEHNLDVIKAADYIVDMGPEGGKEGGSIVVAGTPEEVSTCKKSVMERHLREELAIKSNL